MTKVRHTTAAYLLLLALFFIVFTSVITPFYDHWQTNNEATEALREKLSQAKSKQLLAGQISQSLATDLELLVTSGSIRYASQASEAGHQLQERLKTVLLKHNAQILQLRPSNDAFSDGLAKSRLDVNFRVAASSLQAILKSLAESRPSIHVELLSANNATVYSNQQNVDLDVSLDLAMWYFTEDFLSAQGSLLVKDSLTQMKPESVLPAVIEPNVIAGLFDVNARLRISTPRLEYYRLAAVTISQQTRNALIVTLADGKSRRLEHGDLLDVWRVDNISASEINVSFDNKQETLTLSQ